MGVADDTYAATGADITCGAKFLNLAPEFSGFGLEVSEGELADVFQSISIPGAGFIDLAHAPYVLCGLNILTQYP